MIQAIMLIALGFLIASLIGVVLAPSLWTRAVRLSKKRIEATIPLTLTEIEAAQDQLRATYAVRVRRLESALASTKQKAANQLVDNSRLHMQIIALKDRIDELDKQLCERRNAATVLEQTITKRFPELDSEIATAKDQLEERTFELRDLTHRLSRRDEELAAAEQAASSYQEELQRLHQVLEKSAADRSGRRLRRPSQWNLEDYRAEYDRLNLELSKMRQQLAAFQDRDSQQVGVIKGELQRLAELILASAQPRSEPARAERIDPASRRVAPPALRRERPAPWLQTQPPVPLAALLRRNAETAQNVSEHPLLASAEDHPEIAPPSSAESLSSPVLTILPETVLTAAPSRPKILQEVGAANGAPQEAEENPAEAQAALAYQAEPGQEPHAPAEMSSGNGARYHNGEGAEANWTEGVDTESPEPSAAEDKIGPHQPTLLERLRSVAETEKAPSQGL